MVLRCSAHTGIDGSSEADLCLSTAFAASSPLLPGRYLVRDEVRQPNSLEDRPDGDGIDRLLE